MRLHILSAFVCVLCSLQLQQSGTEAYPLINIPYLFGPAPDANGRYKKSELGFPQPDGDVIELEHLKHLHSMAEGSDAIPPESDPSAQVAMTTTTGSSDQPEVETGATGQDTAEQGLHRPPMLPHHDGGKTPNGNQAQDSDAGSVSVPSLAKPFYGAARLAFGQNPEVLPTSSTSTTTTTTTTTTAATLVASTPAQSDEEPIVSIAGDPEMHPSNGENSGSASEQTSAIGTEGQKLSHPPMHPHSTQQNSETSEPIMSKANTKAEGSHEQTKETIGDLVLDDVDTVKSADRRSVMVLTPKTAANLLRHPDGQYSSFDMAQYVFWTGDEKGVARAVEEFINQGLMSRENALKFLRDIRLGIDYLQRSYANRVFPTEMRQNNVKKSYAPPPTTTTTTTTTSTTTEPPQPVRVEQPLNEGFLAREMDSIARWRKLQDLNNDVRQELTADVPDYEEATGRAKIAEYLYTEYTLEEILYKLAKVMFTQSLAHGSDEAQQELQKLTSFLEREGNLGIIPVDLQKKVLNVLLSALSDTLREHPELLPAARSNLANPYMKLPLPTYGSLK